MKKIAKIAAFAMAALMAISAAGCSSTRSIADIQKNGKLMMSTNAEFEPFEYKDGGEVVGINVETLDGNKQGIETAKQLLEMTGANYRNIYFDASSEAGTFALGIMAFPTTYVFDRNGRIVGEPLLGGIDNEKNLEMLQKTIDEALARDSAVLSK